MLAIGQVMQVAVLSRQGQHDQFRGKIGASGRDGDELLAVQHVGHRRARRVARQRHFVGLNTWESRGGPPPPPGTTGLYHAAILYPTRAALADALKRLMQVGIPLDGASDHGVSEALYLRDPDGNGIELYWGRPEKEWPRTSEGQLAMHTRPLDLQELLRAAD